MTTGPGLIGHCQAVVLSALGRSSSQHGGWPEAAPEADGLPLTI